MLQTLQLDGIFQLLGPQILFFSKRSGSGECQLGDIKPLLLVLLRGFHSSTHTARTSVTPFSSNCQWGVALARSGHCAHLPFSVLVSCLVWNCEVLCVLWQSLVICTPALLCLEDASSLSLYHLRVLTVFLSSLLHGSLSLEGKALILAKGSKVSLYTLSNLCQSPLLREEAFLMRAVSCTGLWM